MKELYHIENYMRKFIISFEKFKIRKSWMDDEEKFFEFFKTL